MQLNDKMIVTKVNYYHY